MSFTHSLIKKFRHLKHPLRVLTLSIMSVFVFGFLIYFLVLKAMASEQVGSSPSSGADSRLKTASVAVTALGYGSNSAGSWGDWGAMWNRIYSAALNSNNANINHSEKNGSGTGTISQYTQALGGVDDYNNGQTIPADTYNTTWTVCNSANSYCGTNRNVLNGLISKDPYTGLVWSPPLSNGTWFVANDCIPPGTVGNPGYASGDNTCTNNGDLACGCVKQPTTKTGCDNYDDGNWRLPYQKELMQSYIDGSYGNLASPNNSYWSSTTSSTNTQVAWPVNQNNGGTNGYGKTGSVSVRCVR